MRLANNPTEYNYKKIGSLMVFILLFFWYLLAAKVVLSQTISISTSLETEADTNLVEILPDSAAVDTVELQPVTNGEPHLGLVFKRDMTLEQAYRMHYSHNYGAYVDQVTEPSPAYRAGIKEEDIITSFGGEKVLYNDHLVRLLGKYRAGDTVEMMVFRDGQIMKTTVTLQEEEQSREVNVETRPWEDDSGDFIIKSRKPHVFYGHADDGILAWKPTWYVPDERDIYTLIENLGYASILSNYHINDKDYEAMYLSGFQIQPGDQNAPLHWGILWSNGEMRRHKSMELNGQTIRRDLSYSIHYWGFTLDTRIPLFDRIYIVPEILAGSLTSRMSFFQPDPIVVWDEISQRFEDPIHNHLQVQKKYFVLQPNVSLILRLTDNIGIQATAAYFYGFPRYNGWKVSSFETEKNVLNSPNSSIGGWTFSFGPCLFLD